MTLLAFLTGLLVLPVGFFLALFTCKAFEILLKYFKVSFFDKCTDVDPYAVATVASRFAVSTTGFLEIKFAGWQLIICPPVKRDLKPQDHKVQLAVHTAVKRALTEAGYPIKAKTY